MVYGCIKNTLLRCHSAESVRHRENNRRVMLALPSAQEWPLLSREMFSIALQLTSNDDNHTDVMHFGSSYKCVEYEWQQWLSTFEEILTRLYWVSAVVHLETAFNGCHTFIWESDTGLHEPNKSGMSVRCEWSHERSGF